MTVVLGGVRNKPASLPYAFCSTEMFPVEVQTSLDSVRIGFSSHPFQNIPWTPKSLQTTGWNHTVSSLKLHFYVCFGKRHEKSYRHLFAMMIETKYTAFIKEEQILGCRLFAGYGLWQVCTAPCPVNHHLIAYKPLPWKKGWHWLLASSTPLTWSLPWPHSLFNYLQWMFTFCAWSAVIKILQTVFMPQCCLRYSSVCSRTELFKLLLHLARCSYAPIHSRIWKPTLRTRIGLKLL